jgi:hypothetical protein
VLRIWIRIDPHQIERKDPDQHHSGKLDPDPHPHQSDELDPDPDTVRIYICRCQAKMYGIWAFWSTFSSFEPIFGT